MAEELQLSLARWRAGEWKCGAAAGAAGVAIASSAAQFRPATRGQHRP
jgi:hypothetical protein